MRSHMGFRSRGVTRPDSMYQGPSGGRVKDSWKGGQGRAGTLVRPSLQLPGTCFELKLKRSCLALGLCQKEHSVAICWGNY